MASLDLNIVTVFPSILRVRNRILNRAVCYTELGFVKGDNRNLWEGYEATGPSCYNLLEREMRPH